MFSCWGSARVPLGMWPTIHVGPSQFLLWCHRKLMVMSKEHGAKPNVSFFPRTSLPSIFNHFQNANMEGGMPGRSYHMQWYQVVSYRHTWKRGGGIKRMMSSPLVVFIQVSIYTFELLWEGRVGCRRRKKKGGGNSNWRNEISLCREGGRTQGQLYIEVTQYSHQQGRRGTIK